MKIVVTGATGLLGRPLVERLRREDHAVTVLTRNAESAARALPAGTTIVAADLESPGPWAAALRGADAIVHLAGESIGGKRWDSRQKQILRDSRVEATRVLVEAIAALPAAERPRALISASGADYYPFAPDKDDFDDDEVTEQDAPSDSFLGRLCRDWEREALAARAHGLRVVVMRTGLVLDWEGGALPQMAAPFKVMAGGPIGGGRQWVSWIHRDDAVAIYAAAISDARYDGAINLVTDSTRQKDVAHAIGKALGKPSLLPTPKFAVKLAVGELAEYLLHGRRVVPKALRAIGFQFARATIDEAVRK